MKLPLVEHHARESMINFMIKRTTFIVVLLLLLSGCSAMGSRFQQATPPSAELSLVYIYRLSAWGNILISPAILIDGDEKLLLKNNGYSFFYLPPGLHTIRLKLSDRYKGLAEVQVNTEANRSYYVRVDTSASLGIGVRTFGIGRVPDEIALEEIKDCNYLDPEKSGKFSKSYILEDN